MKKIIYGVLGILILGAVVWFFWPSEKAEATEVLQCPVGQIVQAEVSHTETVVDTAAWDEVVVDTAAYTSCDYVGAPAGDYKNSSCTSHGDWWQEVYKKTNHAAVTHTVHHDAVTHEETVIDSPEQCVTDPNYTPEPDPTPEELCEAQTGMSWIEGSCQADPVSDPDPVPPPSTPSSENTEKGSQSGGSGRCDRFGKPTCVDFFASLGIPYGNSSIAGGVGSTENDLLKKLLDALQQLLPLLVKLQSLKG